MTEAEWLACTDPEAMLQFLQDGGKTSERKLRLAAVALCRFWRNEPGTMEGSKQQLASQRVVEVAERYADGLATREELVAARASAMRSYAWNRECAYLQIGIGLGCLLRQLTLRDLKPSPSLVLCDLLGTRFRPTRSLSALMRSWHDGLIPKLAQSAYEHRPLPGGQLDAARLAVLADALEEAGCTDRALLDHLRGPGPHVRGCWAIDLLTARG
jgi:hypothetical protein